MRICQIVGSLESRHGGPSKSVRRISESQAKAGHSVSLLSCLDERPTRTVEGNLEVCLFPREVPASICRSPQLAAHLKETGADVVHHSGLWLRTLHYAHVKCRKSGIPLVISPRGMMADWAWNHHRLKKQIAATFIHPGAIHGARGWHATSQQEADEIRARGVTASICVAPNGVQPPPLNEASEARLAWEPLVREAAGRPIALFYSRFHSKKRVEELIRLWGSKPRGDWLLLVAGIPEEFSIEYLRSLVRHCPHGESIRVEEGTNRPPPYSLASLFVFPSHSENFGLVIAEAMASGLPVVVTNTTPWQAVDATGAGWCVPWESFSATLDLALATPETSLRSAGASAAEWVLAHFSWAASAATLAHFYSQLSA